MAADDMTLESDFNTGDSDDPDKLTDSEALGARHRRRYGYSAEGAEENDQDILAKGRAPLKSYDGPRKQQNAGASRTGAFNDSVVGGLTGR